jgi:hypothetical protein
MSQIARIKKTQMVVKEHLVQALQDLGHAWQEGGTVAGRRVDIKIEGRNVGFRKSGKAYDLVTRGMAGIDLRKLTQRYAYQAARAKLEEQGFTLANETQEKGRIHLVLRRMA